MTRSTTTIAALVFSLIFLGAACGKKTTTTNTSTTNTASNNSNTVAADPTGTIVVEAGDGTLTGVEESSVDYIKESARGLEAYLGSRGASANYTVTASAAGTYKLMVKLTDDGLGTNGFRDADVTVNGAAVLHYYHKAEDTRGWKWYTLGNVSLKVGENPVAFTKSNDMPSAYVMDEFKFVPVILQ